MKKILLALLLSLFLVACDSGESTNTTKTEEDNKTEQKEKVQRKTEQKESRQEPKQDSKQEKDQEPKQEPLRELDKEALEFVEKVERAVDQLPDIERDIIKLRYMSKNHNYINDYTVYESKLFISKPTYIKVRNRAFESLYKMLVDLL